MTAVSFIKSDDLITGFELKGHAGFSKKGTDDLLCAVISSAVYMTVNTITDVLMLDADICEKDGYMKMRLSSQDALKAQDILKGFELHITELSKQYQRNIKVKIRRCK